MQRLKDRASPPTLSTVLKFWPSFMIVYNAIRQIGARPPIFSWFLAVLVLVGTPAVIGAPANQRTRSHWAFVPPQHPAEPPVRQITWPRNTVDRFILARLEQERIAPSPEADRRTLIRRLSLDLTGLTPSIHEVEEFVRDSAPDAYERLVERLLASPHYGERWARPWLDAARYADSNGYSIDAPRSIWKYRDWVIQALNADMPFDQFTIEQLAGDLLPNATIEQRIATGFHRNTPINEEGGIDKEQFRIESVIDRVNTTATVFLGLTLACAQCHDHKYDPFTQKEYFQFYAFLNNDEEPTIDVGAPEQIAQLQRIRRGIHETENELKKYIEAHLEAQLKWEKELDSGARNQFRRELQTALDLPHDKRSDRQKQIVFETFRTKDARYVELQKALADLRRQEPKLPTTMALQNRPEPRESYVFIKGDFTRKGETVTPNVPAALHRLNLTNTSGQSLSRLDLARWIVDPRNPLTARVAVNRIWQAYFGKGIVETENDFGTQGSPPSHPELLDWLATELIRQNWSLKALHRLIVHSATYRQSSRHRPELAGIDPNNRLLARQNRLRLEAEVIRDVALCASGQLSPKVGGPGVFPPQPEGVMTLGQSRREWKTSAGADRYRRGLYTFFWRATPHPSLMVFDAPDATGACTRRIRSNTPLQALTLLNDQGSFELAQALARRILAECHGNDTDRIQYAFQVCLSRLPASDEHDRLRELLAEFNAEERQLAWTTISRVLLNLDEFITRE